MKNIFTSLIFLFFITCSSQENYFDLGKKEMANQNLGKAVELLSKAIEKKQNTSEAYFARGLCYNLMKNFEKSTQDFTMAENLGFNDIKLYTLRGFAYNQINKNELALKDLDRAIEINPEFYARNFYNRAMLENTLNKNENALSDLNEFLKREEDPNAYYQRAMIEYYKFNNSKDACIDIEKTINLGLDNEEVQKQKKLICK